MSERPDPFRRQREQFRPPQVQPLSPTLLNCSCGLKTPIEPEIPFFWPVACRRCKVVFTGPQYESFPLPDAEAIVTGLGALEAYVNQRGKSA
jgi:hypothetical protein